MKNYIKIVIILAVGFAIGFFASSSVIQKNITGNIYSSPSPVVSPLADNTGKPIVVSLMIDFGGGRIITCNKQSLVKEKAVFNLLEACSTNPKNSFKLETSNDPNFGVFVKQIGDLASGKNNKYWQFWVNNEYAQVGASQYQLKEGDVVEWKFVKGQF